MADVQTPKTTGKGVMGKVNATYGVAGLKLPLWGWGAIAFGGYWIWRHVFSQGGASADGASGSDGTTGIAGGGGMGSGDFGGGVNDNATNPGSIATCPPGYHQERHRCVPNRKGVLPRHHHPHKHGESKHAHPHAHAGSHVHHHEKRAPLRQLPKRKRPHGTPRRVPL